MARPPGWRIYQLTGGSTGIWSLSVSGRAFGISMDMLLRMQAWHDGYVMRQRAGEIDVKPYEPA